MIKRTLWIAGGLAALALLLAALPSTSQTPQDQRETMPALHQHLEEMAAHQGEAAFAAVGDALPGDDDEKKIEIVTTMGEGGSWLGVELQDVDAAKSTELKLPAERGALLSAIVPDSPAAKAGLKEQDVITELNGQRVEGAVQFRRMVREIPAGRTLQLAVWRGGKSQTVSATLAKREERHGDAPRGFRSREFNFRMPEIPEVPEMPDFNWHAGMLAGNRSRLGIDGDDLSGQLGEYFGAPDGEAVLVRGVNEASPAEKAGIKAGDVLIKFNGERIRTVGDLREKLAGLGEMKEKKAVKITLLRNRSEMTVEASIEPPPAPKARAVSRRTHI